VEPRFSGSAPEAAAREYCRSILSEAGFTTIEEEFSYSEFPARFGPFICGILFSAGVYLASHFAIGHRAPILGMITAVMTLVLARIAGAFLLERVLSFPAMRRRSTNLIATRADNPVVWLVAHTDSKSQTIGMLTRVASIVAATAFLVVMMISMIQLQTGFSIGMEFSADVVRIRIGVLALVTIAASVPFTLCFIGNKSRGALDNASGVAAVLLAAELLDRDLNVGVVLTSGEEVALAGAKAFVAARKETGIALNCDTIDSAGRFLCMTSGKGRRAATAMAIGARKAEITVKVRGTLTGVLTDSIAFAEAGWDTTTLSRGNLKTLALVHTSGDVPERIDGTGIALAARVLAATVEEIS